MNQEKDIATRSMALLEAHDFHGDIAVFIAAGNNDVDVLKWLKEQRIDINVRNEFNNGQTPMHFAASQGAVEGMKWLKNHIDINARDYSGQTPTHCAASTRSLKAIKWLNSNGADIHARDSNYRTPMDIVARYNFMEGMKWFRNQEIETRGRAILDTYDGCDDVAVFVAVGNNDVDILKWLKAQGSIINVRNKFSNAKTPMHFAASQGAIEAMEWLKTEGFDIDVRK